MEHESLDATLLRLKKERDAADRAYNDALTALDRASIAKTEFPAPPPEYDEHQITPLNEACNVLVPPPASGGVKGRLAAFVWRLIAPTLERQSTFNSRLVDHLNRNVPAHRGTRQAFDATLDALRRQGHALLAFQGRLLVLLQQITAYVDTKDRDTGGGALVVNAAVNAVAAESAIRWESLTAREQRLAALADTQRELRTLIGVTQQATITLKREIEKLAAGPPVSLDRGRSTTPDLKVGPTGDAPLARDSAAFAPSLDAYKYVGFEHEFRGPEETIRAQMASYLPYFDGTSDVLDVGCGRGEFLELLKAKGISGRGLDLNHEMAELCRSRGLDVAEADVVSYLEALPDGSLGGLFAAQVVEHLQPGYLLRFLDLANAKLRPGSPIVLETLNPACWVAFFESFIRDITHVWPLHPETLRYLVLASGFSDVRIEYRSPVPPHQKLQPIAATGAGGPSADLVEAFNENVGKLNARLFTFMDYAIVGTRP